MVLGAHKHSHTGCSQPSPHITARCDGSINPPLKPRQAVFLGGLDLGWFWRSGVFFVEDGDLILSLYFAGRGRLLCSGGCEGSCLHARLSVSGSSNTNTAAASCAMLRKETETSGLCLKQLRGLRRAAPWAGCAVRAAQHLRPSRLPLPFPEPCNWDAEDGLSKAEPPGSRGGEFVLWVLC